LSESAPRDRDSSRPSMKGGTITAKELKKKIERGEALQLIDVRMGFEFNSGHIPGAVHMPAPSLNAAKNSLQKDSPVILICAGGPRAFSCQEMIQDSGLKTLVLEGGTSAWMAAGYEVERKAKPPFTALRQSYIIASLMVLAGLYLGLNVSQGWFALAALPGFGLMLSGVTGFCPMEWMLRKAPWNKGQEDCAPCGGAAKRTA